MQLASDNQLCYVLIIHLELEDNVNLLLFVVELRVEADRLQLLEEIRQKDFLVLQTLLEEIIDPGQDERWLAAVVTHIVLLVHLQLGHVHLAIPVEPDKVAHWSVHPMILVWLLLLHH